MDHQTLLIPLSISKHYIRLNFYVINEGFKELKYQGIIKGGPFEQKNQKEQTEVVLDKWRERIKTMLAKQ